MSAIRAKSISMTQYLENLLGQPRTLPDQALEMLPYQIITPSNPEERGAQLSIHLQPGLLEGVMKHLRDAGVVVDERKPDVVRVAPAPLYNTYCDIWEFARIFKEACWRAQAGLAGGEEGNQVS